MDTTGASDATAGDKWIVDHVVDGDTLVVTNGFDRETVRLLCIDTPERGELRYEQASAHLAALVESRIVRLVPDPRLSNRDAYGRLLRYIFVGDMNISVEMIRAGFTGYVTKWGKSSLYDPEFRAADQR